VAGVRSTRWTRLAALYRRAPSYFGAKGLTNMSRYDNRTSAGTCGRGNGWTGGQTVVWLAGARGRDMWPGLGSTYVTWSTAHELAVAGLRRHVFTAAAQRRLTWRGARGCARERGSAARRRFNRFRFFQPRFSPEF
jgi:hypothetical protein